MASFSTRKKLHGQCFSKYANIPKDLVDKIEEFAFAYGKFTDSYLITEDNRSVFISESGKGILGFAQQNRYYHVTSGLLAATDKDKADLLTEFIQYTESNNIKAIASYTVPEEDAHIYIKVGAQVTKMGEDPVIDLRKTDWKGKPYQWVRRQLNYGRRKGLKAEEIKTDWNDFYYRKTLAPELIEISNEYIEKSKNGSEINFFVGRFIPENMLRKRLFIARSTFRIEAFIVCNPGECGAFWGIEMYRRRSDSPRGTMPFLIMEALAILKDTGVRHVSLSIVPFYNCSDARPGDNTILRRLYVFAFKYLNWYYDFQGLYLFRSRFRPQFRSVFVAHYPRYTSLMGISSIRLLEKNTGPMFRVMRLIVNVFNDMKQKLKISKMRKNKNHG